MKMAYFLLGSNLGDRQKHLNEAVQLMSRQIGPVVTESSIYATVPWGLSDQPEFLNKVIVIQTALGALEGLNTIQQIEHQLGRTRSKKWSARTIDIDILFWGDDIIDEPGLQVPHPEINKRRFTLVPLSEVAGNLVHPQLQKTVDQLLNECEDMLPVWKLD